MDADYLGNAEGFEGKYVGSVVDAMGRDPLGTVAAEKGDLSAAQEAEGNEARGLSIRALYLPLFHSF
jgi:hypothetical protein